jgi:hypothetical protein
MNKYSNNPNAFYRDMRDAAEYLREFVKDDKRVRDFETLVYVLGCKFSEEGTTYEQERYLDHHFPKA